MDYVAEVMPPQIREAEGLIPLAQNGDPSATNRILEMYMRVVLRNALWAHRRYAVAIDDAIQEAALGLLTAVNKYELQSVNRFDTYAPWWIRQRMMRELPVHERVARLPIHFRDKVISIVSMVDEHECEECGRVAPCRALITQIQSELDCNESDALFTWSFTQFPYSIETIAEDESSLTFLSDYGQQISAADENIDGIHLATVVEQVISCLKPREREIIEQRYGFGGCEPMTLEEIGSRYGVTRERIRQIEAKAIRGIQIRLWGIQIHLGVFKSLKAP